MIIISYHIFGENQWIFLRSLPGNTACGCCSRWAESRRRSGSRRRRREKTRPAPLRGAGRGLPEARRRADAAAGAGLRLPGRGRRHRQRGGIYRRDAALGSSAPDAAGRAAGGRRGARALRRAADAARPRLRPPGREAGKRHADEAGPRGAAGSGRGCAAARQPRPQHAPARYGRLCRAGAVRLCPLRRAGGYFRAGRAAERHADGRAPVGVSGEGAARPDRPPLHAYERRPALRDRRRPAAAAAEGRARAPVRPVRRRDAGRRLRLVRRSGEAKGGAEARLGPRGRDRGAGPRRGRLRDRPAEPDRRDGAPRAGAGGSRKPNRPSPRR